MSKFKARYEISDGYVGKARPIYCNICSSELEDDMTDDEIEELYHGSVQDHFEQNISPESENLDEFIEWAKSEISKMEKTT